MHVYINRQPINVAWGGGAHFFNAFHEYVPKMIGSELEPADLLGKNVPDVILLAGLSNDGSGISVEQAILYRRLMRQRGYFVKLVMRINENDARKGTSNVDASILNAIRQMDGVVYVSDWMRSYFEARGCDKRVKNAVIINGVNSSWFKPNKKFENGTINIVTHHWSNHQLKGFDIYEKIDEFVGQFPDRFSFTYIGRERQTFKHSRVIKPLYGKALGEELGKYDVYVSASRADPGPNHAAESISCKLPTYVHVDGGGAVEFAGTDHVYKNWEELKNLLQNGVFTDNVTQFDSWEKCVQRYVEFFQTL